VVRPRNVQWDVRRPWRRDGGTEACRRNRRGARRFPLASPSAQTFWAAQDPERPDAVASAHDLLVSFLKMCHTCHGEASGRIAS